MKRRKPKSRKEWKRIVREQERSGLTAVAFCRRKNVGLSNFYRWRRRLSDGGEREVEPSRESFIDMGKLDGAVALATGTAAPGTGSLVVALDLGDGARLTIRRG